MAVIIHNARIHTLDPAQPLASAIAIEGETICAIGSEAEVFATFKAAEAFNAEGRTILPGLTDAHMHFECYALGLRKVDCETSSRAECLQRVTERASQTPPGQWILGHGWNQNNWSEGYGSVSDLDAIAPHHPVYLTAKSLHAAWANSAALLLAGIDRHTPDPTGGRLGRSLDGNPDGILFETAMNLITAVIPEASNSQVEQAILQAQPMLLRSGLTSLHDFDHRRCFVALQNLHQQGHLQLRVTKCLHLEEIPAAIDLGIQTGFGDETLRIGPVKGFADGALGPHTAAMLQPYADDPQNTGILMLSADDLFEQGRPAVDNGLSLAIHAIGDRANHEVLNAFARLRAYEAAHSPAAAKRLRHRVEHVQVLHPSDAGRLAELGVIASMQPIHAPSDMVMADRFWGERSALSYAWRTQLDHGAVLAFGSDAPVESPNPFWGLHAAVTRRRADGSPGADGWRPEQRLNLLEALQGFTSGPAYATGLENRLGKLAPGFLADLLVLDRDIFACDPEQIKDTRPVATMVGGAWAWRA
jgi:predicted amidohydrolase YtcJ